MESLGLLFGLRSKPVGEDVLVGRNVTVRFVLSVIETGVVGGGSDEVTKFTGLDVGRRPGVLLGSAGLFEEPTHVWRVRHMLVLVWW